VKINSLMMAIRDLTLCLAFATRMRCEPRILLPELTSERTFAPVREPITLAALPLRAAYSVLAVAAAALDSLEADKRCNHWKPDGGAQVILDAASLLAWLPAASRGWLRSQAALWERPAGEALGLIIAAVDEGR
jgi:hypothetical protein